MDVNKEHLTFSDFLYEKHRHLYEDAEFYKQNFITYKDFFDYVTSQPMGIEERTTTLKVASLLNDEYKSWMEVQRFKEKQGKEDIKKYKVFLMCYRVTISFIIFYFLSLLPYIIHHEFTAFGVIIRLLCITVNAFNLRVQIKSLKKTKKQLKEAKESLPIECKMFKTIW